MKPRPAFIIVWLVACACLPGCGLAAPTPSSTTAMSIAPSLTPFSFLVPAKTPSPTPTPTQIPGTPTAASIQRAPQETPPPADAKSAPWTSPVDGMTLLPVPAGDFLMGTLKDSLDSQPDEIPQHKVTLSGFWIDQTEVTTGMYAACIEAGGCTPALVSSGDLEGGGSDVPIAGVTWDQALAYCTWAGRRLPTEAEWEKAARGKAGRLYPWGWIGAPVSAGSPRLNFCDVNCPYAYRDSTQDDGFAEAAPVGSFPSGASPYGALDMAGNVWEWVADWYQSDFYQTSPGENPTGPGTGTWKVMRGGSWLEASWDNLVLADRSANRATLDPNSARVDLGFRCAAE